MITRYTAVLAAFLMLAASLVVFAQVDRAHLNGTVTDSARAVVPDARVEVVSRNTGLKRVVQTGPGGVYSIVGLPIGTYDLTVSRSGFRSFELKNIGLLVGQTRTVDA